MKTKNEKIIKNYPLTSSQLKTDRTPYVSNGVYKNGYLYFIVQGVNAIYRIDGNLEKCAVYLDGSNYGGVGASSLCFHNDKIMYVTSDGCVVAYDGKAESVFCKIPPMNETKGYGYDFFNNRYKTGEESNYLICSDGENVFCSEGTNIYLCTADGLESLNFDVALLEDSGRSFISKIEFADDGDLMYVTLVYCGSETSKQIRLYVYDVDNGKQACFKQKTKARFRDCHATQTDS